MNNLTKINNLPPYSLGAVAKRIHEIRMSGGDVIDLSQMNPTIPPPQIAIDKLVQASLVSHNHRYTASSGINILCDAFAKYYHWKFFAEIDSSSELVVTNGTKEGVVHLLMSILSPGDSMLVPVPSYPVHTAAAALMGVSFVGVPLWKDYDEFFESDALLTAESEFFFKGLQSRYNQTWPRPKVILINFPHNPTTTVVSRCFYERLIEFAEENNCFVINDFAHGDLFYDEGNIVSFLGSKNAKEVGVELYSLSKGFSLAGWRVGCALGHSGVLNALKSLKSYTDFGIFQPLQIAAANLLLNEIKNNGKFIAEVVASYVSRRDLVCNHLNENNWKVQLPKASPFVWAQIPKIYQLEGSEYFCRSLLEEKKVALFPGTGFDYEQDLCVRISLTENETRLRDAMKRLMCLVILFLVFDTGMVKAEDDCPKALSLIKKSHVSVFSKEEIRSSLDEANKICPQLVEGIYEYGRFYLKDGKFDLAEEKFKKANELKPRVEHALGIAVSQSLRKDYSSAENTYKQALTTYLGHWSLLEGLGVLYLELNKLSEAEELLRQALQTESSVDSIYYNLGLVLEKQGRYDEAQISLKTALDKNEKSTNSAIALMRLYLRDGQTNEAIRLGRRALLHAPNNEKLLFTLADAYVADNQFSNATEELNKIKAKKNEIKKLVLLCLIEVKEAKSDEGLKKLSALLLENPENLDVLRGLGFAQAYVHDYRAAETTLLKALELSSNDPVILNDLGTVYEGLGQIEKAKEFYARAQSSSGESFGTSGSFKTIQRNIERLR